MAYRVTIDVEKREDAERIAQAIMALCKDADFTVGVESTEG